MGGGKLKRRREAIEVWAWRNEYSNYVRLSIARPEKTSCGSWDARNMTALCPVVFKKLTGISTRQGKALAPVRVRIPAWTVLDGGKLKGGA